MTEEEISALVKQAVSFPWTVTVTEEDGELVSRVAEMPDAIATGATYEELERDLWDSIRASLHARVVFGDPIPRPKRMAPIIGGTERTLKLLYHQVPQAFETASSVPVSLV